VSSPVYRTLQRASSSSLRAVIDSPTSFGGKRSKAEIIRVDADLRIPLNSIKLNPESLAALEAKGFKTLTPIQGASFQIAREGRDILARSRTGTGKTIAFSLPLFEALAANMPGSKKGKPGRRPRYKQHYPFW
jgi:superfamily II DNA/RNA helicase